MNDFGFKQDIAFPIESFMRCAKKVFPEVCLESVSMMSEEKLLTVRITFRQRELEEESEELE